MEQDSYKLKQRIDENGYFIEDVFTNEVSDKLIENQQPIKGMLKPRWDGTQWVDDMVDEYIKQVALSDCYGKRLDEYPPIAEQLDKIFHEGIDAWKAEIQAIKEKYPKPL
jgi:hypothetical protein